MRTVVLVPRRGGGWRDEVWEAVRSDIEALGYPVYTADSDTDVFAITHAWNRAAREAGDWDQAILHLADHWVTPDSVHAAVDSAHPGIRWCYDRVVRLSRHGTRMFLDGHRGDWPREWTRKRQLPYPLVHPYNTYEGPRIVTRELWQQVGGFDERSVGWGAEDQLFTVVCEKVYPSIRMPGDLVDLWHPKQPADESDPYYANRKANRALLKQARLET